MVQIDEDSTERIMNCIQTLSELTGKAKAEYEDGSEEAIVKEIFLRDTKKAFERMIGAQEVRIIAQSFSGQHAYPLLIRNVPLKNAKLKHLSRLPQFKLMTS